IHDILHQAIESLKKNPEKKTDAKTSVFLSLFLLYMLLTPDISLLLRLLEHGVAGGDAEEEGDPKDRPARGFHRGNTSSSRSVYAFTSM
ncbi:MAG: hypothetical protein WCC10_14645, partial [Tumebacillaceae bacterium]